MHLQSEINVKNNFLPTIILIYAVCILYLCFTFIWQDFQSFKMRQTLELIKK